MSLIFCFANHKNMLGGKKFLMSSPKQRKNNMNNFKKTLISCLILLNVTTLALAEYPQNTTNPNFNFLASRNTGDFHFDGLTNVTGNSNAVFFIDPAWTHSNNWKAGGRSEELNLGAGIRLWTPNFFYEGAVVGANVYYDRQWTVNDNTYNQLGIGMEFLSEYFDARVNGFIPFSRKEGVAGKTRQTYFNTTAIHSVLNGSNEYAFWGYNAELGIRLPFSEDYGVTRVYLGYDDFNARGISNRDSLKLKATYNPVQFIQFAFQYYFDRDLLDTHWLFGANFNIPLDWSEFSLIRNKTTLPVNRLHERVFRY